jgi:hypothetical protein
MATGAEVLSMLIPTGGWVISGDTFEGITFIEADPILETEFKAGFAKVDKWKADQAKAEQLKKDALFAKLGITADEAALLLQ